MLRQGDWIMRFYLSDEEWAAIEPLLPPLPARVRRLVRPVSRRCIAPAKAVTDHEDNPAQYPPVINSGNTVRQREIRLNPAHLRLAQHKQTTHKQHLLQCRYGSRRPAEHNQPSHCYARNVIGPEPSSSRRANWISPSSARAHPNRYSYIKKADQSRR